MDKLLLVTLVVCFFVSVDGREPNAELSRKWRQVVKFYDVDNNGVLSKADYIRLENNLVASGAEHLTSLATYMWDSLMHAAGDTMTEDEFVTKVDELLQAGKLGKVVGDYRSRLFDAVDKDDNGTIDADEFGMFSRALGRLDDANQARVFAAIDSDNSGLISKDEYVDAYVRYFTDPECKLEDLALFGNGQL